MNVTASFSGFSVSDIDQAKQFYSQVLGCELQAETGGVSLKLPDGNHAWMYAKADHRPAAYTMLNFVVDDIDQAVADLTASGVVFEVYPGAPQDEKAIMRGKDHNRGPNIAWFKDPAGNILAVLER